MISEENLSPKIRELINKKREEIIGILNSNTMIITPGNIADYALIEHLIEQSGVTIHLVKENVILSRDSRSNEKFIFGIKALMAKNYVDNLSEETKKGMMEKAEQGIYPSFAPYGYINQTAAVGKKKKS